MRFAAILILVLSTPAVSQDAAKAGNSPGVDALRAHWEQQSTYVLRSAEQMPEADYAFKPVATVRSFGQLIAHVAGSQYSMCASALGETCARGGRDREVGDDEGEARRGVARLDGILPPRVRVVGRRRRAHRVHVR